MTKIIYGFFIIFLLIGAYIDYTTFKIPNWLNLSGALLGIVFIFVNPLLSPLNCVLGALFGFIFFLIVAILSRGGFGAGDVKFLGVIGLYVGLQNTWYIISLSYIIQHIYMALTKKEKGAFAPAISIASLIITYYLLK